ncbi:MAG: hypothetical protein KA791_02135 [Flavobacteriales bacterium]|nr:hypothetical protein [Flavobacteriales bacterium]
MITTNLPAFIDLLNGLCDVQVHDSMDGIELHIAKPVNVEEMDDLVCDALFVDPISRTEGPLAWTINLWKRDDLRTASDMRVVGNGITSRYEMLLNA